jgi:tripartite ATP-independent transporter DctP family solute receptor
MKLSKIAALAALCAIGVMLGACSKKSGEAAKVAGEQQKITLKVGDTWSASHPIAQSIDKIFKPQIESKTNGVVTVEVYHSGVLGNEQALWDGVRSGSIEVVVIGSVMNTEYKPMLISDWPFLYRDLNHAKKVWTGSFADDFIKEFDAFFPQVHMLSVGPNSARTFTSNKKLTTVDDFKGQKFRMPSNPIHVGIVTDLGASAQVIPLNELFNALQTGVVDGQDNGMVTVLSEHLNEVQKYLYETNHIVATMEIVVNSGVYDKLTPETKKIVSDAAKEAASWAWDTYIKSVDTDRETLKADGLTVTPLAPADQTRIINAIQPTLTKLYAENNWAKPLTDKVKAVQ